MTHWLDWTVLALVAAGFLSGVRAGFFRVVLRLAGLLGGVVLGLAWAPAVGRALYTGTGLARRLDGWLSPRLPLPAQAAGPGGMGAAPVSGTGLGQVPAAPGTPALPLPPGVSLPAWLTDMLTSSAGGQGAAAAGQGGILSQVALLLVDGLAFLLILLAVQVAAEMMGRVLQASLGRLPGLGLPLRLAGGVLGGLQSALLLAFLLTGAAPVAVALWPELGEARSLALAGRLSELAVSIWRQAVG